MLSFITCPLRLIFPLSKASIPFTDKKESATPIQTNLSPHLHSKSPPILLWDGLLFSGFIPASSKQADSVLNATTDKKERICAYHADACQQAETRCKISKPEKSAQQSDLKRSAPAIPSAICKHPLVLEYMDFPEPVINMAVEPKTQDDVEKLNMALRKLAEEDPTFQVRLMTKPARP